MISNLDKYKDDLDKLITQAQHLNWAILHECDHPELLEIYKKVSKIKKISFKTFKEKIPSFRQKHQSWYSEALVLIRQLLPERLNDFKKFYERPKTRKEITCENYTIEDYLFGITVTRHGEQIVGQSSALHLFVQQAKILESVKRRFESSLFDIKHLVQADLFDSELEKANELNKKGFERAAGAVAGVVLESHILEVCENHSIIISKKDPTLADLSQLLKKNDIIDIATWRKIEYLTDIRNKCDHKKKISPTKDEIDELLAGTSKIIKTVF